METEMIKDINTARLLTDQFLSRTGIKNSGGNLKRRYLWTDAIAVQACFALSHLLENPNYKEYAMILIEQVHLTLGRYRNDEPREGWISGLSEEEGKDHPTAGGLRIGKELPERSGDEPFNQHLEWDRDGQYFHYLTRWFHALLQAYAETGKRKFAVWASELIGAGQKFIQKENGNIRMFWKMNTDLSSPAVKSMGAHDPLEGLICVLTAMNTVPDSHPELVQMEKDLRTICRGMDWFTNDPLGIGGLLFNTVQTSELDLKGTDLPPGIRPESLYIDSLSGLKVWSEHIFDPHQPPEARLAFRECGLSLGFRVLNGMKDRYQKPDIDFSELDDYLPLIKQIDYSWTKPSSQRTSTWTDHIDINTVTLASTLLAEHYPYAFNPCSSIS